MKVQKQLFRHNPENGVYGDCYRTCIACLLDLEPGEVPHVNADTGAMDMQAQKMAMDGWLAERGLCEIATGYNGSDGLDAILATIQQNAPAGLNFMLTGTSRTGCNHTVVMNSDGIVCDPSLTDSGIVGPADDGYFWVSFIGKLV